ncbi:MAG: DUF433 domain-containing protein [Methanosarcinales archaeon]|nr:DUF433 domain-containing protein [Methanosarcinales archaeon]
MFETRINIDPEVMHGMPIIKGARVSVDVILRSLASGMEMEEIEEEYEIGKEDILASI